MAAPTFSKYLPALVSTEEILLALGRYTKESNESYRRTAAMLGIKRATLIAWLEGTDPPQRRLLARLAGFLRRVGYL
jgi:transcriptional regulator with XRE-family HTH domain